MDSGLAEDRWQIGWIDVAAGAKWKVLRSLNVGSPRLVAPFGAASPGDTRRQKKLARRQRKVLRRQRKGLRSQNAGIAEAASKRGLPI